MNVEPAKDEVMFEDLQVVTELFEQLCKRVYGEVPGSGPSMKKRPEQTSSKQRPFDLLLAKRPVVANQPEDVQQASLGGQPQHNTHDDIEALSRNSSSESLGQRLDSQKRVDGAETKTDSDLHSHRQPLNISDVEDEGEGDLTQPQLSNPFILAKINSRVTRCHEPKHFKTQHITDQIPKHGRLESEDSDNSLEPMTEPMNNLTRVLPSRSELSPDKSIIVDVSREPLNHDASDRYLKNTHLKQRKLPALIADHMSETSNMSGTLLSSSPTSATTSPIDLRRSEPVDMSFSRVKLRPSASKVSPIRSGILQQPFRTPFKKSTSTTASTGTESTISYPTPNSTSRKTGSSPRLFQSAIDTAPTSRSVSELEDIMEFEHRKKEHILQHRAKYPPTKVRRTQHERSHEDASPTSDTEVADLPSIVSSKALYEARFNSRERPCQADSSLQAEALLSENDHLQTTRERISFIKANSNSTRTSPAGDATTRMRLDTKAKRMHLSDPRAYLIESQAHAVDSASAGRVSKSKIAKLPFESIVSETATYATRALLSNEICFDLSCLTQQHQISFSNDRTYTQSGIIQYAVNDSPPDEEVIDICKTVALQMIQERWKQSDPSGVVLENEDQ